MRTIWNMFGIKWPLLVGIVLLLPLLFGCQEESQPDEEAEMSLNFVPTDMSYASLPLIGTQWKLVGFANGGKNKIRLAMPSGEDTYLLVFDEDGGISGRTSTNTAAGKYSVDIASHKITISEFTHLTKINELFDGKYYIELMNNVFAVKLSAQGLELHYDSSDYLLFQPLLTSPSPSIAPIQ
jgi:hypothetical protein